MRLNLETPRPSASTSTLELSSFRLNIWLLVFVWSETEMLDGLARVLWSSEEEGMGTGWSPQSELIESESFTTGGNDASTGGSGESKSSNGDLWGLQQTVVVGDGSNDDDGLALDLGLFMADKSGDTRERDWWAVDLGHEKAAEDDFVEARVGSASQESVELDQKSDIRVIALWSRSVARLQVVCFQIDTHCVGLRMTVEVENVGCRWSSGV